MDKCNKNSETESNSMIVTPKEQFDALAVLWERAWKSIDERRSYEWKFAFGIWTFLGLVILGLFKDELPATESPWLLMFIAITTWITIILTHGYWLCSLLEINSINIKIAQHYLDKMLDIADRDFRCDHYRLVRHWPAKWSIFCQMTITILLASLALALLLWKYFAN